MSKIIPPTPPPAPWFMVMSAMENEKQGEKVQLSFLPIEVRMAFCNKIFPTVLLSF